MLVQFDCGCIGFPLNKDGWAWLVEACDHNDNSPKRNLFLRQIDKKSFTPLPDDQVEIIMSEIAELVRHGHDLQSLRSSLLWDMNNRVRALEAKGRLRNESP
jgi:hypothetical protein